MDKEINKNRYYDDSWLYILLLSTLAILLESLKTYTFTIKGTNLTYSLFLLPFIYLISNYINKKYDYKKSLIAIFISGIMFVIFTALMSYALGEKLLISNISGEFCGYIISQLINLTIYTFLLNNTKQPTILIFFTYLFSLIVYYMFYTLIYLNMVLLDNFWTGYFITLGIQFVICIPLAIFDKRILRGKEIIIVDTKKSNKEKLDEKIKNADKKENKNKKSNKKTKQQKKLEHTKAIPKIEKEDVKGKNTKSEKNDEPVIISVEEVKPTEKKNDEPVIIKSKVIKHDDEDIEIL